MTYVITEDALTNAIFNNSLLDACGSDTKARARQQARLMLSAGELFSALAALGCMPDGFCFCPHNRDTRKPEDEHTGECRDARAVLYRCET